MQDIKYVGKRLLVIIRAYVHVRMFSCTYLHSQLLSNHIIVAQRGPPVALLRLCALRGGLVPLVAGRHLAGLQGTLPAHHGGVLRVVAGRLRALLLAAAGCLLRGHGVALGLGDGVKQGHNYIKGVELVSSKF